MSGRTAARPGSAFRFSIQSRAAESKSCILGFAEPANSRDMMKTRLTWQKASACLPGLRRVHPATHAIHKRARHGSRSTFVSHRSVPITICTPCPRPRKPRSRFAPRHAHSRHGLPSRLPVPSPSRIAFAPPRSRSRRPATPLHPICLPSRSLCMRAPLSPQRWPPRCPRWLSSTRTAFRRLAS